MSEPENATIINNEYVKEILSILTENGKDVSGLASLLGYVTSIESQLNKAVDELHSIQNELSGIREESGHPVRTAMEKTIHMLEARIDNLLEQLENIKARVIEGCKNAVDAFKHGGLSALNNFAKFFKIKPMLETMQSNLETDIKRDHASIAKIESVSTEYHAAARHIKNIGRALVGKEPITEIRPNGKFTKLISAAYRSELKSLTKSLRNVKKAINRLDNLDKSLDTKSASAPTEQSADKASVVDAIKNFKEKQDKKVTQDVPVSEKSKHTETEL